MMIIIMFKHKSTNRHLES